MSYTITQLRLLKQLARQELATMYYVDNKIFELFSDRHELLDSYKKLIEEGNKSHSNRQNNSNLSYDDPEFWSKTEESEAGEKKVHKINLFRKTRPVHNTHVDAKSQLPTSFFANNYKPHINDPLDGIFTSVFKGFAKRIKEKNWEKNFVVDDSISDAQFILNEYGLFWVIALKYGYDGKNSMYTIAGDLFSENSQYDKPTQGLVKAKDSYIESEPKLMSKLAREIVMNVSTLYNDFITFIHNPSYMSQMVSTEKKQPTFLNNFIIFCIEKIEEVEKELEMALNAIEVIKAYNKKKYRGEELKKYNVIVIELEKFCRELKGQFNLHKSLLMELKATEDFSIFIRRRWMLEQFSGNLSLEIEQFLIANSNYRNIPNIASTLFDQGTQFCRQMEAEQMANPQFIQKDNYLISERKNKAQSKKAEQVDNFIFPNAVLSGNKKQKPLSLEEKIEKFTKNLPKNYIESDIKNWLITNCDFNSGCLAEAIASLNKVFGGTENKILFPLAMSRDWKCTINFDDETSSISCEFVVPIEVVDKTKSSNSKNQVLNYNSKLSVKIVGKLDAENKLTTSIESNFKCGAKGGITPERFTNNNWQISASVLAAKHLQLAREKEFSKNAIYQPYMPLADLKKFRIKALAEEHDLRLKDKNKISFMIEAYSSFIEISEELFRDAPPNILSSFVSIKNIIKKLKKELNLDDDENQLLSDKQLEKIKGSLLSEPFETAFQTLKDYLLNQKLPNDFNLVNQELLQPFNNFDPSTIFEGAMDKRTFEIKNFIAETKSFYPFSVKAEDGLVGNKRHKGFDVFIGNFVSNTDNMFDSKLKEITNDSDKKYFIQLKKDMSAIDRLNSAYSYMKIYQEDLNKLIDEDTVEQSASNDAWKVDLDNEQAKNVISQTLKNELVKKSEGKPNFLTEKVETENYRKKAEAYIEQECQKNPDLLLHFPCSYLTNNFYDYWIGQYKYIAGAYPMVDKIYNDYVLYVQKLYVWPTEERQKKIESLLTTVSLCLAKPEVAPKDFTETTLMLLHERLLSEADYLKQRAEFEKIKSQSPENSVICFDIEKIDKKVKQVEPNLSQSICKTLKEQAVFWPETIDALKTYQDTVSQCRNSLKALKKEVISYLAMAHNIDVNNQQYDALPSKKSKYHEKVYRSFLILKAIEIFEEFDDKKENEFTGKELSIDDYSAILNMFFDIKVQNDKETSWYQNNRLGDAIGRAITIDGKRLPPFINRNAKFSALLGERFHELELELFAKKDKNRPFYYMSEKRPEQSVVEKKKVSSEQAKIQLCNLAYAQAIRAVNQEQLEKIITTKQNEVETLQNKNILSKEQSEFAKSIIELTFLTQKCKFEAIDSIQNAKSKTEIIEIRNTYLGKIKEHSDNFKILKPEHKEKITHQAEKAIGELQRDRFNDFELTRKEHENKISQQVKGLEQIDEVISLSTDAEKLLHDIMGTNFVDCDLEDAKVLKWRGVQHILDITIKRIEELSIKQLKEAENIQTIKRCFELFNAKTNLLIDYITNCPYGGIKDYVNELIKTSKQSVIKSVVSSVEAVFSKHMNEQTQEEINVVPILKGYINNLAACFQPNDAFRETGKCSLVKVAANRIEILFNNKLKVTKSEKDVGLLLTNSISYIDQVFDSKDKFASEALMKLHNEYTLRLKEVADQRINEINSQISLRTTLHSIVADVNNNSSIQDIINAFEKINECKCELDQSRVIKIKGQAKNSVLEAKYGKEFMGEIFSLKSNAINEQERKRCRELIHNKFTGEQANANSIVKIVDFLMEDIYSLEQEKKIENVADKKNQYNKLLKGLKPLHPTASSLKEEEGINTNQSDNDENDQNYAVKPLIV